MAEKFSFFDSVGGDRQYNSTDFANYFSSIIKTGVFAEPSDSLQISAYDEFVVTLMPGKAWINGYFYENTTQKQFTIDAPDTVLNRVDSAVIQLDLINRQIITYIKKGTPSTEAIPSELTRTDTVYELSVAEIYVLPNSTGINQMNVVDARMDDNRCGYVASLIDQLDTDTIYSEFQGWYNYSTTKFETDWNTWFQAMKDQVENDDHTVMNQRLDNLESHDMDFGQAIENMSIELGQKLTLGDYGIGGKCVNISSTSLDNLSTNGMYAGNNLGGAPSTNFYICEHYEFSDGSAKRQFLYRSSPTAYNEIYHRVYSGSSWQPWLQFISGRVVSTATIAGSGAAVDFKIGSSESIIQVLYLDGTVWRTLESSTQIDVSWVSSTIGWRVRNNSANSYQFKIIAIG